MNRRTIKRAVLVCCTLLSAALCLLALYFWHQDSKKPRFQGKTVSEWLPDHPNAPDNEIVNAFGTTAIPELVAILQRKEGLLTSFWERMPPTLNHRFARFRPMHLPAARNSASLWLRRLGTDADSAFPFLEPLASESHFVETIAMIGRDHPQTPEILSELLQHTNSMVRNEAALAPAVLGERALIMLPALTNFIMTHPRGTPFNALLGIRFLGAKASNAVPLLITCLDNPNLIPNTLLALHGIGPGAIEALPKLLALLNVVEEREQVKILDCIRRMGPSAQEAIPTLMRMRSEETNLLQLLISLSLSELQRDRKNAVAALEQALNGRTISSKQTILVIIPDQKTIIGMWYGLGHAEFAALISADYPEASTLLPLLREIAAVRRQINRGNQGIVSKVLAARAIWRHTKSHEEVLPVVANALLSDDGLGVHYALELLEEIPLTPSDLGPLLEFYGDMKRPWQQRMAVLKLIKTDKFTPPSAVTPPERTLVVEKHGGL